MIKDRIIQIIEYKGVAKESFYKKIGVTSANFRGKAKETDISSITIVKILSEFPDVNPEWLLTGKGSMLRLGKEVSVDVLKECDEKIAQLERELADKKIIIELLTDNNKLLKEQTVNFKKAKKLVV